MNGMTHLYSHDFISGIVSSRGAEHMLENVNIIFHRNFIKII